VLAAVGSGKWREVSPLGYIGDPSVATRDNGELYALEAADIGRAIAAFAEPERGQLFGAAEAARDEAEDDR